MKLVRRGFWWLLGAAMAGLLAALLLGGVIVRDTLQAATLARLADDAARLAAAPPPTLPPDAWLLAADGSRLAADGSRLVADGATEVVPPEELLALLAPRLANAPLQLQHAAGLVASHPLATAAGTVRAVAVWQPAARIEARVAGIVLRGLRDAALLGVLCVPAAWIGARLLLTPLAVAASGGSAVLDALRQADLTAAMTSMPIETAPILTTGPQADPHVAAAAAIAAELLERLAATEATVLHAAARQVPA